MKPHKSLLLVYSRDDVNKCLPIFEGLKKRSDVVKVIGVDIRSWTALRRLNIPHLTPAEYLDKRRCSRIDTEAIRLAEQWYKDVNDEMMYDGISLGEMAECDFAFLYIDALRSIDIANSIIGLEKPDEIWLPGNPTMRTAISVRYEALVRAVADVAKREGIQVSCYG